MNTNAKHTPGPWAYHLGRGKYPRFHIQTIGGYQIASTPELSSLSEEENSGREYDAQLIAAAPELLAAIKDLVFFCEEFRKSETMPELWDKAHKVIAKAEGRA